MAPSTPASLARSRPVVLTIVGFSAAFGVFLLYSTYLSPNSKPPLQRSNAVHRRRAAPTISNATVITDVEEGIVSDSDADSLDPFYPGEDGKTISLGTFYFGGGPSDTGHKIPLRMSDIRPVEAIMNNYGFTELVAKVFYRRYCFELVRECVCRYGIEYGHVQFDDIPMRHAAALQRLEDEFRRFGVSPYDFNQYVQQCMGLLYPHLALGHGESESDIPMLTYRPHDSAPENLNQLLYYISEEQSRSEAYVHREVMCNECSHMRPIRGIRWHCINCVDFDLCADCKTKTAHFKHHIFAEIRIPVPFNSTLNERQPVAYTGNPDPMSPPLFPTVRKRLEALTNFDIYELDALYDQFTCTANQYLHEAQEWVINGQAFVQAFAPRQAKARPRPNIVYDRLFNFFSSGSDYINFEDFATALAYIRNKMHPSAKLRKIFQGFDFDDDGYIGRRDVMRLLKAFHVIQLQAMQDLVILQADSSTLRTYREHLTSTQPLGAPFLPDWSRSLGLYVGHNTTPKPPNQFGDVRTATSPLRAHARSIITDEDPLAHGEADTEEVKCDLPTVCEDIEDTSMESGEPNGLPTVKPSESSGTASAPHVNGQKAHVLPTAEVGSSSTSSARQHPSGYEIPLADKDCYQDLSWRVLDEALGQILDPLFKSREDEERNAVKTLEDGLTDEAKLTARLHRLEPRLESLEAKCAAGSASAEERNEWAEMSLEAYKIKLAIRVAFRGGAGLLSMDEFVEWAEESDQQLEFLGEWLLLGGF